MLKKIFTVFIATCFALTLTACDSDEPAQNNQATNEEEKAENNPTVNNDNEIVVYFSWSGNTEAVAKEIQRQSGASIFEINPQNAYTDDYDDLLDIAQQEQRDKARPAIDGTIENFDSYTTIYLGYPNWWGDMPMIIYSFLDDYDLSGKTIVPFCTSGGSGFSSSIDTIKSMEPDATVWKGLAISDDDAKDAASEIQTWLADLKGE